MLDGCHEKWEDRHGGLQVIFLKAGVTAPAFMDVAPALHTEAANILTSPLACYIC